MPLPQMINIRPNENGTVLVSINIKDEKNRILTINDIKNPCWQLERRSDKTIINNRSFENTSLDSLEFLLYGDDLKIIDENDTGERTLIFKCEYDSTLGINNVPAIDVAKFTIQKIF